jgi:2-keto-4-pentenoate hydratase/2-oxohepta-3-ene-1,7-dioic acid hydratase in catechol pathway
MRLVTYLSSSGPRTAGVRDGAYIDLHQTDPELPTCMKKLLSMGRAGMERVAVAIARGSPLADANLKLLAPVPEPQKVICIGLNYADHAKESGVPAPPEPVVFSKFATAVCGHEAPIVLPSVSQAVDYEAELVAVIGVGGRNIARERALEHVAGYCVGHDVSARDWQLEKPSKQWLLGKSFDTFAPFGPELVTADEVGDAGNLHISLRLNGQTMQDSSTHQLIFPIDELVAYISQVCTLSPGDVIFTGTPPGVGFARKPPVFLKPGDVCEVEIERLGVLRNSVVGPTA